MRRLTLLAFLAVLASFPSAAADKALLIIRVVVQHVDDVANDPGPGENEIAVTSYWIKNIGTGQSYGGMVMSSNPRLFEIPEGDYCIQSIIVGNNQNSMIYGAEPFFRVIGGRINNAGEWRFGLDKRDLRLFASAEAPAEIFRRAEELYPEKFRRVPASGAAP